MIPIAKNTQGEVLGVLWPDTVNSFLVDGSGAHAESAPLKGGKYRIAVRVSTGDFGVMITITKAGTTATTATGMFMAHNSVEFFVLDKDEIISVIDGIINVTEVQ